MFAKLSKIFLPQRVIVGKDAAGNTYWQYPNPQTYGRPRRGVDMKDQTLEDLTQYDSTHIPVEWRSWLNHRRDTPPSPEELIISAAKRSQISINVQKLRVIEEEQRQAFKQQQAELDSDVHAEKKEIEEAKHVPFTHQTTSPSTEPTGRGETFQPGEWKPGFRRRE